MSSIHKNGDKYTLWSVFQTDLLCVDPDMETAELLAVTVLLIITDLHCSYFMLSYFCVGFMLPFSVKVVNVLSNGVQFLMYLRIHLEYDNCVHHPGNI